MTMPEPYAKGRGWTLYHGDCLEILRAMPTDSVALLHTDPPFGLGNFIQTSGNTRGRGAGIGIPVEWNNETPPAAVFDEMRRVSRHRIIWGANFFNCFEPDGGAIVWIKEQPMPNFSKADIASCTHYKKTETVTIPWRNFEAARLAETDHPCERPVELYSWALDYLPPARSGLVLDPFTGSGTTGVACLKTGREFIGIEIDEHYCEVAARRLRHAEEDTALFTTGELQTEAVT